MKPNKERLAYEKRSPSNANLLVGNSLFEDDVWELLGLFKHPERYYDSMKRLDFRFIPIDNMKIVIKHYAYHELGCVKPQTVRSKLQTLRIFIQYCDIKSITSFRYITQEIFLDYALWLKNEKNYTNLRGCTSCHTIEELIRIGQIKRWDVPDSNIFTRVKASTLWNPKKDIHKNRMGPIPKEVLHKILSYAINNEQNILTKAGIIIQSQTGLRINEVLSICKGCIRTLDDGHAYMEVTLHKTERGGPVLHNVLVNELVIKAVDELEQHTVKLRRESGYKELFLFRHSSIGVYKATNWSHRKLRSFIRKWDIRDQKGELYHLNSHQFRATFVADLVKKRIPIAYIMKQFSHVSIEMTAYYLSLKQEEIKELYSKIIFHPQSKIAGFRANEIKDKLNEQFRGKTVDEIDTIIFDLSSTMSFNPLPTGICLYDFRRGNCTDGDGCFFYNCPNYITDSRFYPVLKQELDIMDMEMKRLKVLGRERDWQRQYIKYRCLKPLVESLEDMINE